jgi:maleylacetate reductase
VIGAPTSLAQIGLDRTTVAAIADLVASAQPDSPRPVDPEGVRELLLAAYAGVRPTPARLTPA